MQRHTTVYCHGKPKLLEKATARRTAHRVMAKKKRKGSDKKRKDVSYALCDNPSLLLVPSQFLVPPKASNDRIVEMAGPRVNVRAKQLVVFFGAATIGTAGGWGADAVLRACRKVVCRPRGEDQDGGRVVLVDEHRTSRVSSAVNGKQPCEVELNTLSATRPAGWKPPAGQVEQRLLRPAWSQQRGQPVRGLVWCPVVPPRRPPQAPRSSQAATQAAASEPGPSTPQPAKRSKRTKAEPGAAEPTKGKGKGKAAKAKPAPQPGRWLDRDCNAALNMQRIGESRWRPLELCYWPDQGALPAKGKEYPGLGYKRLRDKPSKAQEQQQQPAEAHQAVKEAVELAVIGRQLTATSDFNPATHIAVGVDPGVTQAIKAAHAQRDPATGQVLRLWERELTKGQLKHDSGLTQAKRDTTRCLQAHIQALRATGGLLWEEYLKQRWRRQRLGLHHAQEPVNEGFYKKRGVAVWAGCFSQGGWKANAVREGFRKVVEQPSRPDRLVIVDEFRTSRVSSSVHAPQPCELHLPRDRPRPEDWVPPAGQVNHRLVRPAKSQQHGKYVRGLLWGHEEYQQRYKLVNDPLPKGRQRLHRAAEYRRGIDWRARNNA
ncbi:hypothetical protein QJQ45_012160 [Haematococcus lacustris]|nr:hypothetical protein QJQ45_012160 [Haematococcus lacustris]